MKYKILLTGSNKKLINDFFMQMDFYFECISSSTIFDDLKRHIEYFKPDMFLFCMRNETRDDITTISSFHDMLIQNNIPYAAAGDSSSLDFLSKIPGAKPELTLSLPKSSSLLQDEITNYIVNYKSSKAAAKSPVLEAGSTLDIMSQIDNELEKLQGSTPVKTPSSSRQPEISGRHRILVIDDATIVHKTIKGHLDQEYEVATAISGKIALRFLQAKEVSLILLDYEMPEMNGPDVLKKLREDSYLSQIPVVFLTGINDTEKIKNALSLKPQGYLLKPVDKKALIEKIHELII